MAKVKILKTSTDVMVILNVEKDVVEALKHQPEHIYVQKDKDGKETYRLAFGAPCVKSYGAQVNGESNLVEQFSLFEDQVEGVVNELKFKYAGVEAKITLVEKELLAEYKKLKENAEKVEVESC